MAQRTAQLSPWWNPKQFEAIALQLINMHKGPEPCNVSFVQVLYTRCCCCCCCCRAAVVPFLMLVQLISGTCFVGRYGKLAVSTCPLCGTGGTAQLRSLLPATSVSGQPLDAAPKTRSVHAKRVTRPHIPISAFVPLPVVRNPQPTAHTHLKPCKPGRKKRHKAKC